MKRFTRIIATAVSLGLALPVPGQVPPPPAAPAPAAAPPASSGAKSFSQQELDQLVAPIALYPDALLAQVMMASTYPLEVVQADRWRKANASLKDKALEDALQQQTWDASVKSLAVFPQVLTMMSEKVDWTQKLGDAFLAQQQDVMATVQTLRAKAKEQGALKDTKEQKVTTQSENNTQYIVIEPTNPEVVYVPTYNPTVVYGAWPYPAYPPYYYYPPGYVAGGALLGFTAGIIVGGALWGGCNWGRGDVNVNVNRYNNFNRTNISNGNWNHNASHRGAVPYRDQRVSQQYGRGQSANAASREQSRGRAEAGQQSIQRGDVSSRDIGGAGAGRDSAANRSMASGRGEAGGAGRDSAANRSMASDRGGGASGGRSASAFDSGGSGAQARASSSRGSSSMSSARSSGNMSGGGGGARGGGGGGGGRGGGGRR